MHTNWEYYYNQGIDYSLSGDWEKAASYLVKALETERHLHYPQAWHNTGAILLKVGKGEEAKAYLSRALEEYDYAIRYSEEEKEEYYLFLKACVLSLLGKKEAMLTTLQNCLALDNSYAQEAIKQEDFVRYKEDADFKQLVEAIKK
ncbi:MAG: hypothetical protein AAF734_04610 [Bacteroidota bacterium]